MRVSLNSQILTDIATVLRGKLSIIGAIKPIEMAENIQKFITPQGAVKKSCNGCVNAASGTATVNED